MALASSQPSHSESLVCEALSSLLAGSEKRIFFFTFLWLLDGREAVEPLLLLAATPRAVP